MDCGVDKSQVRTITPNSVKTMTSMLCPSGMAFDLKNNIFYVADWTSHCIWRFDKDLKFIGFFSEGIESPRGMRCTNDRLYVAESNGNTKHSCIKIFDLQGNLELKFGTWGSNSILSFIRPLTINIDENGNIFVCDSGNKKIDVISKSGNYLHSFGIGDLEWPIDIIIRGNLIYVLDFLFPVGVFLVYNRDFNLITKSQLYNRCRAPYFVLDGDGELTFSDKQANCLWHYSTEGTVSRLDGVYVSPKGLVLDETDRIVNVCVNRLQ